MTYPKSMVAVLCVLLCAGTLGLRPTGTNTAVAAELLIILPYKSSSSIAIQEDPEWVRIGESFADYKEATGITAEILTLEDIVASYTGADEQEQIKKAIYAAAIYRDVEYVILVGDMGVFPVRYQLRGYTSDGAIYYAYDEGTGTWSPYPFYRFQSSDGYYSNLWHNDDAGRAFDDWNANGDGFWGEMYYDNVRGIDGNSIHPDVALGRIPCRTPSEFLNYVTKVMFYENFVADSSSRNKALFLAGTFGNSLGTKRDIETSFGGALDTTYVIYDGTSYTVEDSGGTSTTTTPSTYISNFITDNSPQFLNYAGHGAPTSWSEMSFGFTAASALPFSNVPAIAFGASCSTARFAEEVRTEFPPAGPLLTASDNDSMAEGLLTRSVGGGVLYIGCVTTAQDPSLYMDELFFEAIADGASIAGDAWLQTIERFIEHYSLDTFTHSDWIHVDGWPDPDRDGKWDWFPVSRFQHIYKMHFFGDPSLRLNGVSSPDRTPPNTIAFMRNWINREDLLGVQPYLHEVTLRAYDAGSPVAATYYAHWFPWDVWIWFEHGTEYVIPLYLTAGREGDVMTVGYFSVDLLGNTEEINEEEVGFDFTPPVSVVEVDGETVPTTVDGETIVEARSFTITATDNLSGVDRIEYTFGDGSRWSYDMGSSAEISINPCFSFSGATVRYRAIDGAGNVEEEKQLTLNIESMPSAWRACFEKPVEEIYQFPPRYIDTLVGLKFVESIAGLIPEEVSYYFSGPVNEKYTEHDWNFIGNAVQNVKTGTWDITWDTTKAGILNGFYWVRAVLNEPPLKGTGSDALGPYAELTEAEPLLVLINNLTEQDYSLSLQTDSKTVGPGGTAAVDVTFKNIRFGALNNVEMGLILDKKLLGKEETSFTKEKQSLKKGETWGEKYYVSIAQDTNLSEALSIHAFVRADEIGLLLSNELVLVLQLRHINVVGTVQDTLGIPLDVKLTLKGESTSRDVSSGEDGAYAFEDVAPGTYTLQVTGAPTGYRQVYPATSPYTFESRGKDIERNFTFARKDRTPPTMTQELNWSLAAKYGILYGLVYDDPHGTGVSKVGVRLADQEAAASYNQKGELSSEENWLEPDYLVPLDDFLNKMSDQVLAPLPERQRDAEKQKIQDLYGGMGAAYDPKIWCLSLTKPYSLSTGRMVVTGKASDTAGNSAEKVLASTPVSAGFSASPLLGAAPLTVHFKDKSDGPGTEWQWDFGDGGTSTDRNPTHVYAAAGTYTVTMTVYNATNSDSRTRTDLITVTAVAPPKDVYPANGIWKSDDQGIAFYLQKYETGSCVVVATAGGGTYTAFLDPSYQDGISVPEDMNEGGYSLDLLLTDSRNGTAAIVIPGAGTVTGPVSLIFASSPDNTKIPADGIWKSTDGSLNCYLQKYETGSCVLVVTVGDGSYVPFLDPDYADGLSLTNNLDNDGLTLTFDMTDTNHGTLNVMLKGFGTLSKPMTRTYPDTP